jgi:hypothetical protein
MPKPDRPNFSLPMRILVGAVAILMVILMLRWWLGITLF